MKRMQNYRELEQYGIDILTGEADTFGLRMLCDLTERGCNIVTKFLGLGIHNAGNLRKLFPANWNSGSKDDPHVASVLLSKNSLDDLVAFVLLIEENCQAVAINTHSGGAKGYQQSEDAEYYADVDVFIEAHCNCRIIRPVTGQPHRGGASVHAATGRSM